MCWPQIPYTFVRANSDYTHLPLETDGYGNWVEQTNVPEVNFETGELFLSNAPPHRCQRYRGLGFRVKGLGFRV